MLWCVFINMSADGLCVLKLYVDVVDKRTGMIVPGNALQNKPRPITRNKRIIRELLDRESLACYREKNVTIILYF